MDQMLKGYTVETLSSIPENIVSTFKSLSVEILKFFPGSKIMLFGSYAKGSYHADSDIDIAVFLPAVFASHELVDIFRHLCRLSSKYDYDIQPQVFFEDEFDNPTGIVEEIIEFGIDSSAIGI